jgi:hypothetical protein
VSVKHLLRGVRGAASDRRQSPRIRCRLQCRLRIRRKWVRGRVLDVSKGGLCILSPVNLKPKQSVLLQIDVPPRGPAEVEAVAWHVRRVKSRRAGVKTWSVGMMITKADEGFQALLADGDADSPPDASAELRSKLAELPQAGSRTPSSAAVDEIDQLEEDALSPAELDDADLDLLSPAELAELSSRPKEPAPDGALQMFRVRVKSASGPRTRTLTLGAVSAAEAETLARADLGDDWVILEVLLT